MFHRVNLHRLTLRGSLAVMRNAAIRQGLTLVHFSAQPEPFLTQNIPLILVNTP